MNTKIILITLAVLLMGTALFAINNLNMYLEHHRYLNAQKSTILLLDYQIPYRSMTFLAQQGGFFAEIQVTVEIVQADSVIFSQNIKDNIGITNRFDAVSTRKSYLNRLSFILGEGEYSVRFKALDNNSQDVFDWSFETSSLEQDELISDLDLCSKVQPDSTQYLSKFKRNGILYKSEPSIIFDLAETQDIYLYFEVYSSPEERANTAFLNLSVQQGDSLALEMAQDFNLRSNSEGITLRIPISELAADRYTGYIDLIVGERAIQKQFEFVITEEQSVLYFLMSDPEDEYKLMKYFIANRVPSDWASMELGTKKRYISNFWVQLAAENGISTTAMLDKVRERLDYANSRFTHFLPGWTTDMGRVYIRNGAPDELDKAESSDETRYVRKDYQIWKYRGRLNAVYLFIDMQMTGNYKLMYVSGDSNEITNPSWMNYVGEDFDSSALRN